MPLFMLLLRRCRVLFHGEALVAEALCLKEALSWIKELCLENVLVESDALGVVQLLQSSTQ